MCTVRGQGDRRSVDWDAKHIWLTVENEGRLLNPWPVTLRLLLYLREIKGKECFLGGRSFENSHNMAFVSLVYFKQLCILMCPHWC